MMLKWVMDKGFYMGNLKEDAAKDFKSWVMGVFINDPARKSSEMEVKYWDFPKGPTGHETKVSKIIEFTVLLKGKMKGMIGGEEFTMNAGEYMIIRPGTINNMPTEALEDIVGLTVKAPSDPTAKQIIK